MTGPFWVSKREAAVTKSQLMIIYTINVDFPVCLLLDEHLLDLHWLAYQPSDWWIDWL